MRSSIRVLVAACGVAAASCVCAQTTLESFDSVGSLPASGWFARNNSVPVGSAGWFQGDAVHFPPQASAGYLAADYRSVSSLGTISNWQLMPVQTLNNGDVLRFYTRTVAPAAYADRLQVRMSTAGASVDVGTGPTDVGDFATLLMDLNPAYALEGVGSFPIAWTSNTLTITGLAGPTPGRMAFRYFVEHGGQNGANSDYIGIDTVEYFPAGVQEGRCCLNGACMVVSAAMCASLHGGVYGGDGSACSGFACPQPPSGACCTAVSGCEILSAAACANAGGLYRGDNSACSLASCPSSFAYVGDPVIIQDGNGSNTCGPVASAFVTVSTTFPIASAEAVFVIQHPWQGDLKIRLTKVDGPSVMLVDRPGVPASTYGFSAANFGSPPPPTNGYFRIGDAAASVYDAPWVAPPGITGPIGIWKPEESLTDFVGTSSSGVWRLDVSDCAGGEFGVISNFVLILTSQGGPAGCYANCDASTSPPVLNANDFQCFLNRFATLDPGANCDESTQPPTINANDFQCYLNKFAAGCS